MFEETILELRSLLQRERILVQCFLEKTSSEIADELSYTQMKIRLIKLSGKLEEAETRLENLQKDLKLLLKMWG